MNIFHSEHIRLLKILIKHRIDFLLVGGVAVNYYGFPRPTGDLDLWLKPDELNKQKLIAALNEIGIIKKDIDVIGTTDFNKPVVFHIGNNPPFVIDFMTKIAGVKWEEAWKDKNESNVDGLKLAFIHINHLKVNKLMAGRPKDMEDLKQLTRIEKLRKK